MLRSTTLLLTLLGLSLGTQAHELPAGIEFLGEARLPPALDFQGTRVGGLSALTYDPGADVFYVLSDDKGDHGPLRFYTMKVSFTSGPSGVHLAPKGVEPRSYTRLLDEKEQAFPAGTHDPEGLALHGAEGEDRSLWLTSEGNARAGEPPRLLNFTLKGRLRQELALPQEYLPTADKSRGVRHNAALESVTLSADGHRLYTAVENALWQDGLKATLKDGTLVRILRYDLQQSRAPQEFFYRTDPVAFPPVPPPAFASNGLVELLALPPKDAALAPGCAEPLLALERSYSDGHAPGRSTALRLYRICLDEAAEAASSTKQPLAKTLFLDLAALGGHLDNVEGMSFGPTLADGRRTLILVSDDNFDDTQGQVTQFLALALPKRP